MKKEWSPKWKGSSQPRKQRKYRANAPLHVKRKFLNAHLSKDLRVQYKKRSFPVRKGDEVQVMKGSFKKHRGVIEAVDMNSSKVYIDSIKVKKVDGSEVHRPFNPSNLLITRLNMDDKMRRKIPGQSRKALRSRSERPKVQAQKEVKEKKPDKIKEENKQDQTGIQNKDYSCTSNGLRCPSTGA